MSNKVFEEAPQSIKGSSPANTAVDKVRKAARQLAYDVRYKVKGKFKEGQKTNPESLKREYMQQLAASSAPGPVKALARKMLIGESYDMINIDNSLQGLKESIFSCVFTEEKKFILRVTDPKAKTTYYRSASSYDGASLKKRQLEAKGLKVEFSGRKLDDTYDKKGAGEKFEKKYGSKTGKNTVGDKDKDGTKEPDSHEYAGVKDKAIKKAMAKEEVIYEKDDNTKKLDIMKGKNTINISPSLGEQIKAELAAISQKRIEEENASDEKEKGCDDKKNMKDMEAEDPRSMPTKVNLVRNKLRAMGLKMSYDMEGDMVDEKYQGMYQSPAPTYNRLKSKDPKATMSPGLRALKKSDELQTKDPKSPRAKQQKKVSDQINRNFQSARKTVGEESSVEDQMKVSQEYFKKRNSRSPEEKEAEKRKNAKDRAKNYAMHKKPDPYKSRPGESD